MDNTLGRITESSNYYFSNFIIPYAPRDQPEEIVQVFAFLMGYNLTVLIETHVHLVSEFLRKWASDIQMADRMMEIMVNQYVKVVKVGNDGKPDVRHMRNAFSHSHFEILPNNRFILKDYHKKKLTFNETVTYGDLLNIVQYVEIKMKMVELYVALLGCTQFFFLNYKANLVEWRLFF